jgi:hypothetical protein
VVTKLTCYPGCMEETVLPKLNETALSFRHLIEVINVLQSEMMSQRCVKYRTSDFKHTDDSRESAI